LAFGRQFDNWGQAEFGYVRELAGTKTLIPEPVKSDEVTSSAHGAYLEFDVDTLDSLAFPTRGQLLNARLVHTLPKAGELPATSAYSLRALQAFQYGDWAGHVYGEWSKSQGQGASAPLTLGGFLRLSGTPNDSLDSDSLGFGRVVMARKIGSAPAPLGGALRAGFSLEAGGAISDDRRFHFNGLKRAGSVFLSLDSRFGPVFFGAGATQGGGSNLYLFLGPIW
jgi:NTE family protein